MAIKKNMRLAREQPLSDGSYLSHISRPSEIWRRHTNGVKVRVIDLAPDGVTAPSQSIGWSPPFWTIKNSAAQLAALYQLGKSRRPWTN